MTYAYLASPYSGTPEQMEKRYYDVMECTCNVMRHGQHAFSPILHCHRMALEHDMPTDAKFWNSYNKAMLSSAVVLFVLTIEGWRESKGVAFEREFAVALKIPEIFIDIRGNTINMLEDPLDEKVQ